MKHGVRPTRAQRVILRNAGLNHKDWLVIKDTPELMEIVHRHSDRTRRLIRKESKR